MTNEEIKNIINSNNYESYFFIRREKGNENFDFDYDATLGDCISVIKTLIFFIAQSMPCLASEIAFVIMQDFETIEITRKLVNAERLFQINHNISK